MQVNQEQIIIPELYAELPQDIIVNHLFPRLPLSRVIEITEANPILLPKTKEHILDIGRSIGIRDAKEAKEVLSKLEMKKKVYDIYHKFQTYFIDDIIDFLYSWVDEEIYRTLNDNMVFKTLHDMFLNLFEVFVLDWNNNLDTIFQKQILKPEVYESKNWPCYPKIFSERFPNFYQAFYRELEEFLFHTDFCKNYDGTIFADRNGNLHPIIKGNMNYNANRLIYCLLFD
jgi:hypothetical protein